MCNKNTDPNNKNIKVYSTCSPVCSNFDGTLFIDLHFCSIESMEHSFITDYSECTLHFRVILKSLIAMSLLKSS